MAMLVGCMLANHSQEVQREGCNYCSRCKKDGEVAGNDCVQEGWRGCQESPCVRRMVGITVCKQAETCAQLSFFGYDFARSMQTAVPSSNTQHL